MSIWTLAPCITLWRNRLHDGQHRDSAERGSRAGLRFRVSPCSTTTCVAARSLHCGAAECGATVTDARPHSLVTWLGHIGGTVEQSKVVPAGPVETLEQKLARLTAENMTLSRAVESKANATLSIKVSKDTGTVVVGGLGRYPTSLYPDQWVKVLAFAPRIAAFLRDHADELETIRLVREAERNAK